MRLFSLLLPPIVDLKNFVDGMLKLRLSVESLFLSHIFSKAEGLAILLTFSIPHLNEMSLTFGDARIERTFRFHGRTTRRRLEPDSSPLCFLSG